MPAAASKCTGLSGEVSKMVGSRPSNSMKVWSILMSAAASRTAVAASLTSRCASMSTVAPLSRRHQQVDADAAEHEHADADGAEQHEDLVALAERLVAAASAAAAAARSSSGPTRLRRTFGAGRGAGRRAPRGAGCPPPSVGLALPARRRAVRHSPARPHRGRRRFGHAPAAFRRAPARPRRGRRLIVTSSGSRTARRIRDRSGVLARRAAPARGRASS